MAQQDDGLLFFWFLGAVLLLKRLSQTVGRWVTIHSFRKSQLTVNTMCAGRVRPFPRNRRISIVSIIFPPPQKINITIPRIQC